MDKEQFLRNIQEEDNNSLRTGAANRILQLLQRQRYNNNEDSVKSGFGNCVKMQRMFAMIAAR